MTSETKILLDAFSLSDDYDLPYSEIEWRAKDCADRRADLWGWTDIEIKRIRTTKNLQDINWYDYEIWGHEQKERKQ